MQKTGNTTLYIFQMLIVAQLKHCNISCNINNLAKPEPLILFQQIQEKVDDLAVLFLQLGATKKVKAIT